MNTLHSVNNVKAAKRLIKLKASVNRSYYYSQDSPLHCAKNVQIARLLLSNGARIGALNYYGRTPLHCAKDAKIAQLLINHKINVNARDGIGNPPLSFINNVNIAKVLIRHGADVHARNEHGNTPLFYSKNMDVVKLLIKHKADVNAQNINGDSPLGFQHFPEIAEILINAKANINQLNNRGQSPLYNTFSHMSHRVSFCLLMHEAHITNKLLKESKYCRYTVEILNFFKKQKNGVSHHDKVKEWKNANKPNLKTLLYTGDKLLLDPFSKVFQYLYPQSSIAMFKKLSKKYG